ncbi:recombinase family protein [Streptomyces sp. GS7]|uniref:recombinase family protein n=1 Tax=Streptomyces sp. GS7 TaxID=2692234 RepID=UPI0013160B76|nr:recombinase family protein [Streptomyces sp. GS7]QHC27081.1 recombinase family protein [Streptomyces sp. GS7]
MTPPWKALGYFREGDTLVVPSPDRLGRSIQDVNAIVAGIRKRGRGVVRRGRAARGTPPAKGDPEP